MFSARCIKTNQKRIYRNIYQPSNPLLISRWIRSSLHDYETDGKHPISSNIPATVHRVDGSPYAWHALYANVQLWHGTDDGADTRTASNRATRCWVCVLAVAPTRLMPKPPRTGKAPSPRLRKRPRRSGIMDKMMKKTQEDEIETRKTRLARFLMGEKDAKSNLLDDE